MQRLTALHLPTFCLYIPGLCCPVVLLHCLYYCLSYLSGSADLKTAKDALGSRVSFACAANSGCRATRLPARACGLRGARRRHAELWREGGRRGKAREERLACFGARALLSTCLPPSARMPPWRYYHFLVLWRHGWGLVSLRGASAEQAFSSLPNEVCELTSNTLREPHKWFWNS